MTYAVAKPHLEILWKSGLSLEAAADSLGVSKNSLRKWWVNHYGRSRYEQRIFRNRSRTKKGPKPPRAKRFRRLDGYIMVDTPKWWRGTRYGNGRSYEHHVVLCEHLGLDRLPHGYVVHHINEKKDDNRVENLELMKRTTHHRIHRLAQGR